MIRALYGGLIRLYPRSFREQFESELLDSFDDARRDGSWGTARLLADTAVSVMCQWLAPANTTARIASGPLVQLQDYRIGRWAMADGLLMSLLLLGYLMLLLNPGPQSARIAVGAPDYPAPRLLTVARETLSAAGPRSQVLVPARPMTLADRLREYAVSYFQVPVLKRLDRNADFRLSFDEIANAPQVLTSFDTDGDGNVTAAELKMSPAAIHALPVTHVLDSDGDLTISATEIRNASRSLRRLDLTRDGELGIIELMPDRDFQNRLAAK